MICKICKNEFIPVSLANIICSNKYCKDIWHSKITGKKPILHKKTCKFCGENFETTYSKKFNCGKKSCQKMYYAEYQKMLRDTRLEEGRNKKREIIYRDYKEPLIPLQEGFGFDGVISEDKDTGDIQCHQCGNWFQHLSSHINSVHKDDFTEKLVEQAGSLTKAYRDRFGIMRSTALCSSKQSEIRTRIAMTFPKERLNRQGKLLSEMAKEQGRIKRVNNGAVMELKNKRGLCYMQLLDTIRKKAIELGRTPKAKELIGSEGQNLWGTINKQFGSVSDAMRIIGLNPNTDGGNKPMSELPDEFLLECLKNFTKQYKRKPSYSDVNQNLIPNILIYEKRFGSWDKAKRLALTKK